MAERMNRQIFLKSRPVGFIKETDFGFREVPVPGLEDGQVLVRNLYMSLDPAMRGWMSDRGSYRDAIKIGDVMDTATVGVVAESRNPKYNVGDKVVGFNHWEDYSVPRGVMLPQVLPEGVPLPLTAFLSVMGTTGLTAYFGLLDVGQPKEGDTVVVSTAAGAVGSIVGQIAKIKGCRTVGITGSDEKCAWIKGELGYDAAINYKTEDVDAALRKASPKGVDVYFDNVGGAILNSTLGQINQGARVAICGAITQYNSMTPQPGPSNYIMLLIKRARMEGFIVLDYLPRFMEGVMQIAMWVMEGKIKYREDIVDGLENAPKHINKLFDGSNTGKLMVRIASE